MDEEDGFQFEVLVGKCAIEAKDLETAVVAVLLASFWVLIRRLHPH